MPVDFRQYTLVSTNRAGEPANGSSEAPHFSPDGDFILFESRATNLAPGNANQGNEDVFLKNLITGEVTQLSTNADGAAGNGASFVSFTGAIESPFSSDGTKVLFSSLSSNLVAGDSNFSADLFMKDLESGEVTMISVNADGLQSNAPSLWGGTFSPDGGSVLFDTAARFVAEDTNNSTDAYIKNLATGEITLATALADGGPANGDSQMAIFSPDGSQILFASSADNLVKGDTNGQIDVFLKDLGTGEVTLVSAGRSGGPANSLSLQKGFSPDGTSILFTSGASNLVGRDTNGAADLFVYDIATGGVTRVSTDSRGRQLGASHESGTFMPDGSGVLFTSATSLSNANLYLKDFVTGETSLVTRGVDGDPAGGFLTGFSVSPDGLHVAVGTNAGGLVDDPPGGSHVYVGPVRPPLIEIRGTGGPDRLFGTAAAEKLLGLDGNDALFGRGGNDRLDGGRGADVMDGGTGHDTYIVNHGSDEVIETRANGDVDGVISRVSFTLGANVENLQLTGGGGINGTGNGLANTMIGNGAANRLNGGAGNDRLDGGARADTMAGGSGNDRYMVDRSADRVVEAGGAGIDSVTSLATYRLGANVEHLTLDGGGRINGTGNGLANTVTGNDAANQLNGGGGGDRLVGRGGNDTYIVDNRLDRVFEESGGGRDFVRSSVNYMLGANVENLQVVGTARNGTGNNLANTITGNGAANQLNGRGGVDRLVGRSGNDTYIVDNRLDSVVEGSGGGRDVVRSSVNYMLGANVENLQVVGTAQNGTGNGLDNTITGNGAANQLNGRGGVDRLVGRGGNDTYIVDNRLDSVVEGSGGGRDLVRSSVSEVLGGNVENLLLTGAAHNGTGNSLANRITGNAAANRLDGRGQADVIAGGGGNDRMFGGDGNDRLTGGSGRDIFYFDGAPGGDAGVDTILDFSTADDLIALDRAVFDAIDADGRLAGSAFREGRAARDSSDRIIHDSATGRIFYDADGSGADPAILFARVDAGLALTSADFTAYG